MLRSLAATVAFIVERWFDEHAAWQAGGRRCAHKAYHDLHHLLERAHTS